MFKNHQKCLIFIFPQFSDFWQKVLISKLKKTSIYEIIIGLKNVEFNVRDLQGRTLFRFSNSVKIEKCEKDGFSLSSKFFGSKSVAHPDELLTIFFLGICFHMCV